MVESLALEFESHCMARFSSWVTLDKSLHLSKPIYGTQIRTIPIFVGGPQDCPRFGDLLRGLVELSI